ncbi:hypothetical protein HKX48_005818 [Thoreauomyces humboldtii]|nr:hypothetical protein HKX48_005818 [Thoreauomyces humboldtii]
MPSSKPCDSALLRSPKPKRLSVAAGSAAHQQTNVPFGVMHGRAEAWHLFQSSDKSRDPTHHIHDVYVGIVSNAAGIVDCWIDIFPTLPRDADNIYNGLGVNSIIFVELVALGRLEETAHFSNGCRADVRLAIENVHSTNMGLWGARNTDLRELETRVRTAHDLSFSDPSAADIAFRCRRLDKLREIPDPGVLSHFLGPKLPKSDKDFIWGFLQLLLSKGLLPHAILDGELAENCCCWVLLNELLKKHPYRRSGVIPPRSNLLVLEAYLASGICTKPRELAELFKKEVDEAWELPPYVSRNARIFCKAHGVDLLPPRPCFYNEDDYLDALEDSVETGIPLDWSLEEHFIIEYDDGRRTHFRGIQCEWLIPICPQTLLDFLRSHLDPILRFHTYDFVLEDSEKLNDIRSPEHRTISCSDVLMEIE